MRTGPLWRLCRAPGRGDHRFRHVQRGRKPRCARGSSYAYLGHLCSRKSFALWDGDGLAAGGHTELIFSEVMARLYKAHGSQGLTVQDGNLHEGVIRKEIAAVKACTQRFTLIGVKAIIGRDTPNKADRARVSGADPGHLGFGS